VVSGKHYSPTVHHGFGDPRCGIDQEALARERLLGPQPTLLSFAEAKAAGEAMFDRWAHEAATGRSITDPPLDREDQAWTDLARVAWEDVWARRRER
jgi:hypothetical protein